MARGETTDEFADRWRREHNPVIHYQWPYYGGNPGDPGWVSDDAREIGDRDGLDAEALDSEAEAFGWEFHNEGWRRAIEQAAVRLKTKTGES